MSSYPLSRLGRRRTLLLAALVYVAAFVVLGSSSAHEAMPVILAARALMGLAVGLSIPAAQIYVSHSHNL